VFSERRESSTDAVALARERGFSVVVVVVVVAVVVVIIIIVVINDKEIPIQAWTDPEGSRRLRLPDFKTLGT